MSAPTIAVFDSGLGGLTVFSEVIKELPNAGYVYCADDLYFPYGDLDEATLSERVPAVIRSLEERYHPDLIVVACNTASTVVLLALRERFDMPFVGTVPAVKPAAALSRSKLISVLGTESTVQRAYTRALIRDFAADCEVTLVGSSSLAAVAEASLRGEAVDAAQLRAEIAPCFVEKDGRHTDVVVLGCTHFPLLKSNLVELAPWPVEWLDPAPAIARRVADLLPPSEDSETPPAPLAVFTSGDAPTEVLARYGFEIDARPLDVENGA
jgi:glutamate racemase